MSSRSPRLVYLAAEMMTIGRRPQFVRLAANCSDGNVNDGQNKRSFVRTIHPSHFSEAFWRNPGVLTRLGMAVDQHGGSMRLVQGEEGGGGDVRDEDSALVDFLQFLGDCRQEGPKLMIITFADIAGEGTRQLLLSKLKEANLEKLFLDDVSHFGDFWGCALKMKLVEHETPTLSQLLLKLNPVINVGKDDEEELLCHEVAKLMSKAVTSPEMEALLRNYCRQECTDLAGEAEAVPLPSTSMVSADALQIFRSWSPKKVTLMEFDREYDLTEEDSDYEDLGVSSTPERKRHISSDDRDDDYIGTGAKTRRSSDLSGGDGEEASISSTGKNETGDTFSRERTNDKCPHRKPGASLKDLRVLDKLKDMKEMADFRKLEETRERLDEERRARAIAEVPDENCSLRWCFRCSEKYLLLHGRPIYCDKCPKFLVSMNVCVSEVLSLHTILFCTQAVATDVQNFDLGVMVMRIKWDSVKVGKVRRVKVFLNKPDAVAEQVICEVGLNYTFSYH